MKIRTDFVTNSSSSSFVLSFRDKESIKEELENDSQMPSEYIDMVSEDIQNNIISKEKAIEEIKEGIERKIIFRLWNKYGYQNMQTDEIQTKIEAETEKVYKKDYEKEIENGNKIFSLVDYDDHYYNSDLEQCIMPALKNTIISISNH